MDVKIGSLDLTNVKYCECGHADVDHLHNGTCVITKCRCTGYEEDYGDERLFD